MRRFFTKIVLFSMLFCGIATIFSCNTKQAPAPKSTENEVAEAVCNIYDHIFECYGAGNDSLDVFNRRYLTSNYNKMIDSVRAFDLQHCPGEVGFFEYDHWVMGQDFDKPSYTLDTVFVSDTLSDWYWATVTIHNFGDIKVHLLMMQEDGEWKIGDMLCYDFLQSPLAPSELDNMCLYMRDER